MFTVLDVLKKFYPNSHYTINGEDDYSSLVWISTQIPKPTQDEISALKEEMSYINVRCLAYPSIQEQLDLLWHDINNNPDIQTMFPSFYQKIKGIKDMAPKTSIEPTVINENLNV